MLSFFLIIFCQINIYFKTIFLFLSNFFQFKSVWDFYYHYYYFIFCAIIKVPPFTHPFGKKKSFAFDFQELIAIFSLFQYNSDGINFLNNLVLLARELLCWFLLRHLLFIIILLVVVVVVYNVSVCFCLIVRRTCWLQYLRKLDWHRVRLKTKFKKYNSWYYWTTWNTIRWY